MNQPLPQTANEAPLSQSKGITTTKTNRRSKDSRGKSLRAVVRQRLNFLGYKDPILNKKETNFNNLIDKLTADLHGYVIEAKHWQDKYLQLQASLNPSLTLTSLELPNFRSNAVNMFAGLFDSVLDQIDKSSSVWGRKTLDAPPLSSITATKPDFCPTKAKQFWDELFAPINANPSRFFFEYAPPSRVSSSDEYDDPDMDFLEKKLATATDSEVIDMLHYCSLFTSGMQVPIFQHPELTGSRDHLGRNCERLLREVIFTRDLTSNPKLAQCLVDGLLGTLWHLATHERTAAMLSILDLSWKICEKYPALIHPFTRGVIAYSCTVISPTASRRALWMSRNLETLRAVPNKYYYLTMVSHLASSFYALMNNDEDSLLHYLAKLDELLVPHTEILETFEDFDDFVLFSPVPASLDDDSPSSSSSYGSPTTMPTNNSDIRNVSANSSNFGEAHTQNDAYVDMNSLLANFSDAKFDHMPTDSSHEDYVRNNSASDNPTSSSSRFQPPEHLKSLIRILVHLLRAEASLMRSDYENCMYWVTEAEKDMQSVPHVPTLQTEEILLLKYSCKRTCPFPSGTCTVIQEFERRTTDYYRTFLKIQT